MQLTSHRYGKARVRALRVVRGVDGMHEVHEVEVAVMLEGDFADTYLTGDNHQVVPTDTIKNTVQILAARHLGAAPEGFALALGDHFLDRYDQVRRVEVEVVVRPWDRLTTAAGAPHPHAFVGRATEAPFARATATRAGAEVAGGVRDLLLLKSAGSGFTGFPRCELTTLPETTDRILATRLEATWAFADRGADFAGAGAVVRAALRTTFADEKYSPSLQHTLFLMARAALAAAPPVRDIFLAAPNKHYLPVDFRPFGQENAGEIFLPTDEPHGQIEAHVSRVPAEGGVGEAGFGMQDAGSGMQDPRSKK